MPPETEGLPQAGEVTALLRAWRRGDEGARERLIEQVYSTLRKMASAQLRRERRGQTLDATGLVHEAYVRLAGSVDIDWRDRSHFFAIASIAMRRVLVDRARAKLAAKRDPGDFAITHAQSDSPVSPEELLDLDQAIERLAVEQPRLARVVEMRYFAGLEHAEIADVMGVSDRTVKRDWAFARAWLLRELSAR
jgi:RNA polymerase sigma factor (TIGR02999 family)